MCSDNGSNFIGSAKSEPREVCSLLYWKRMGSKWMMKPYKLSCVKQRPKLIVDRKQQKACRHQAPQKHLHQITSLNWRQRLFCLHQEYSSLLTSMQGNGSDRYSTLLMISAVDGRKNFLSLYRKDKSGPAQGKTFKWMMSSSSRMMTHLETSGKSAMLSKPSQTKTVW